MSTRQATFLAVILFVLAVAGAAPVAAYQWVVSECPDAGLNPHEVYALASDGSSYQVFFADPSIPTDEALSYPAISPDETKIAYHRGREYGGPADGPICWADIGTGEVHEVSKVYGYLDIPAGGIVWFPDAGGLLFSNHASGIHRIDLDPATDDEEVLTENYFDEVMSIRSSDWRASFANSLYRMPYRAFTMDMDGNVTPFDPWSNGQARDPLYSPDGSLMLIHNEAETGIYLATADGTYLHPAVEGVVLLSENGANAWSPDGQTIAFVTSDEIWAVESDGSNLRQLTHGEFAAPRIWGAVETPVVVQVAIDIKPESDVNPVNPKSQGVVPVAIFSSAEFDATDIDPSTVLLAGAPVALHAGDECYMAQEVDVDGDGLLDLFVHIETEQIDVEEIQDEVAILTGVTYSDVHFRGSDTVTIVPPDTPNDSWAIEEIGACLQAGIVQGYPDGNYHGDWQISRAQMAVFIARSLADPMGETEVQAYQAPTTPSFDDVPTTFWAYKHIELLAEKRVVTGYPDGFYRPAAWVTRDQMAVFIARAIADPAGEEGLSGYLPPVVPTFKDVPANGWAYKYVEYLVEQGVVKGFADGCYRPAGRVNRNQMAVYVARAFGLTD